jgi:hypothetical protein
MNIQIFNKKKIYLSTFVIEHQSIYEKNVILMLKQLVLTILVGTEERNKI